MAHTIGFATSPTDLLDKIRIWLLTRGWSQDSFSSDGTGYRLHMHKSGTYLNFRSYVAEIPFYIGTGRSGTGILMGIGTGYDGGLCWYEQAGGPRTSGDTANRGTGIDLHAGPFASHQFFDDEAGNYLLMVESLPGVWRHMGWGESLDKTNAGTWTGGQYLHGFTSWNYVGAIWGTGVVGNFAPMSNGNSTAAPSFVRADVDTFTGKWLNLRHNRDYAPSTGKAACNAYTCDWTCEWTETPLQTTSLKTRLYNLTDSRAILMPMMIFAKRDQGGFSFLGTVPSIAISGVEGKGISIGQDVTIGTETWRLFNGFLVKVV